MFGIILDRQMQLPLKRQLYTALRDQMILGKLIAGTALPSTRELAKAMNISRNTACEAYEMLLAEGYLVCRQGARTVVADNLCVHVQTPVSSKKTADSVTLLADFQTGRPDTALFPMVQWQRAMRAALTELSPTEYGYTGPQGLLCLREEIAAYLYRGRGISISPEDVFITAGATHAIHIAAGIVKEHGSVLLSEDPCHTGMRKTFSQAGLTVDPVMADGMGLETAYLPKSTSACCLYVTPSHQFPLGGILPAARRAALILYAREKNLFLIEDDYDSEFRYKGDPVTPLYALDPKRVIYIGTFSKTMFPALRIGYAIVPKSLQTLWMRIRTYSDVQNPPFEQAALAYFLRERMLDRHIQKMRKVYGKRREVLIKALQHAFSDGCIPLGDAAGLHMAVRFPGRCFDTTFHKHCLEKGVFVTPAEYHSIKKGRYQDTLLLGFGHLTPDQIERGILLLAQLITQGMFLASSVWV